MLNMPQAHRSQVRLCSAVGIALFFYVRADIMIWQRIFETDKLWHYAGAYHRGWYQMLLGLLAVGCLLLPSWRERILYAVTLYILAFNGTNDVLYYWLDGKAVPQTLAWLDNHFFILFSPVTAENLIVNCLIWITVLFILHRYA